MARISGNELERRWALVRARMEANDVDALVAMSDNHESAGGYAQWLTGERFGYTLVIVFHRSDLMTRFEHGSEGDAFVVEGEDNRYRGVGKVVKTAEFCSVSYSHKLLISNVVNEIAKRGDRRVGLLGPERMGHGLVEAIQDLLAGKAEITDETDFVDGLIAIKSPEEMALLEENVGIQTAAFNKLLAEIKPGIRDIDAENLVRSETYALGGTGGFCNLGSAPMGKPCVFATGTPQRRLEKGDQVTILIETKGPDGYFTEMGRTLVLGRASQELHDASALATEAIDNFRRRIKVGGNFPEVIEAHNAFMAAHGLPPEKRVLAHSQGYDVVQRALIREDETLPIAQDMFFATHPTFATKTVFGWMCDNFVIDANGASETLHDVPQIIFEV